MSEHDHDINKRQDDFIDKQYMGVVEDPNDPRKEGRCRVRVFGIHGKDIPTEHLPWAYPKQKGTIFGQDGKSGAISIPKVDSVVVIGFDNGNFNSPEYYNIHEIGDDVRDELQKEGEYLGSHFLLFDGDEDLKIWFTRNKGITMQLKESRINIGQDKAITIEHAESQSIIELRGTEINIIADSKINVTSQSEIQLSSNDIWVNGNATRVGPSEVRGAAVLGDQLHLVLLALASAIDGKYPPTPGATQKIIDALKEAYLSKSVTNSA